MEFIADFHIHSRYSRATSRDMDLEHISEHAKLKGIALMGTGDFTHFLWLEELKVKLKPKSFGIYEYDGIDFILTTEVSCIFSKEGQGRRVHLIIFAPTFSAAEDINKALAGFGNLTADGRPMLGIDCGRLAQIVMGISADCLIVPGHAWTPWYSVFGSNSGFNSLAECFEDQLRHIYSIETGLSSDPAMNWRLSALDKITLISNSDAHSPAKIGREANVFDANIDYKEIIDILRKKDRKRFLYTIEFFPEEGKYHYDGHRLCNQRLSPKEAKAHKNICPVCKKRLTIGVMHRVDDLADRGEGFQPEERIPFKNLIPLDEIIAEAFGVGVNSIQVEKEYRSIISRMGPELRVLEKLPKEDLMRALSPKIAEGIIRVREGDVKILPGYDGEYGKIQIFQKDSPAQEKQLSFF